MFASACTQRLESLSMRVFLPLQVVFEVSFNSARGGRVAVDDISFSPEFCSKDTGELQSATLCCDFKQVHFNVITSMIEGHDETAKISNVWRTQM